MAQYNGIVRNTILEVMSVISCIIFISQESLTRMHKRIYWHTNKSLKHIYLRRFHVLVYYHYPDGTIHVFFAMYQWALDSTQQLYEWHEKFNFCETMRQLFCVVFHVHQVTNDFASSKYLLYQLITSYNDEVQWENHVFLHANLRMYCDE